ncbi:MAG: hypothetical protein F4X56_07740 [Gammaproteobacteria bacterium]|nr:hypothetical protein [Gammaproteobacteria bacterium]MYC25792.1 hypothetical protein [Gammaproteobacteria bacterium]
MNSQIVRIVTLIAGILIGFGIAWGILFLSKERESTEPIRTNNLEESSSNDVNVEKESTSNSKLSEPLVIPDDITQLDIPQGLFDQKHAIANWVASLDEDQILNWLEQSTQPEWNVSTTFRTEFQTALVQKLSQSSPEKALKFAAARIEPVRANLGSIVISEWATSDLDRAINYVKTTTSLTLLDRSWVLHSILQSQVGLTLEQQKEIARELGDEAYAITFYFQSLLTTKIDDPEKLWYEIVELAESENRQHTDTLEAVAQTWIERDGLQILDEVTASITDKRLLQSVTFGVLMDHADVEEQTEEAFEYTFKLHDDFPWKGFILRSIISQWARYDHMAVLNRAETLPPSSYRQDMIEDGYREKARIEPKQTLENLDSLPPGILESISQTAIRELTKKSPTDAVSVVLRIEDKKLQQELATSLVYTWRNEDLDATKNWILSLPTDEPLRDALLAPLANSLTETDPRLAFEIALQQSLQQNGENLRGHEASVVRRIAQTDIDLAIELLPNVREESRFSTYRGVTDTLIGNGDSKKAIGLVNDLTTEEQSQFVRESLWSWIQKDAEGLKNSIGDLEQEETRMFFVQAMIGLNDETKAYDAKDLQILEEYLPESVREAMKQFEAESSQ